MKREGRSDGCDTGDELGRKLWLVGPGSMGGGEGGRQPDFWLWKLQL